MVILSKTITAFFVTVVFRLKNTITKNVAIVLLIVPTFYYFIKKKKPSDSYYEYLIFIIHESM